MTYTLFANHFHNERPMTPLEEDKNNAAATPKDATVTVESNDAKNPAISSLIKNEEKQSYHRSSDNLVVGL
ncbi:unnamed protein product [Candida verbasci]|uniref:Uncharacterized protein n=1 Tax=Candida verbasci TaxID=1227364 RepID=A0A9W4XDP1_9ASCO|nr:unnamed protein product [Candida verbasci]